MLRSFPQAKHALSNRVLWAMEAFRQRKNHTKLASAKAVVLIKAKTANPADEHFVADSGSKISGHGLSETVLADSGAKERPPRDSTAVQHLEANGLPVAAVRQSSRARKFSANLLQAEPPRTNVAAEAATAEPITAEGAAAAVASQKPKRKRAAKATGEARPTKKAAALTAGAPSHEHQVWDEGRMAAAVAHLRTCDPGVAALAEEYGPAEKLYAKDSQNVFASLTKFIAGQQLAIAAAAAIYRRFLAVCQRGQEDPVQPKDVLAADYDDLRACGLSGMKTSYLIDLARHFDEGLLSDESKFGMDDLTLITELTKVKGIGRWSVDMFSMFHLGRPDVLPVGDLAVRNGMKHLYNLEEAPTPEAMEALTEQWRPYRSLGSYYMWKVLDKKTAAEKAAKAAVAAGKRKSKAAAGKGKVKAGQGSKVPLS